MKVFDIFRQIAPPAGVSRLPVNRHATWYTWSKSFRDFLKQNADGLQQLNAPKLIRIPGLNKKYNLSFSSSTTSRLSTNARATLLNFARGLYMMRPSGQMLFFDDLICDYLDGQQLHSLFACLRGAIVETAGDELAAIYSPLISDVGKKNLGFPLHADLYIPQVLFNVFDAVPSDDSGASVFLSVSTLKSIMSRTPKLPSTRRNEIIRLLHEETGVDRFENTYDLLHGNYEWVAALETAMSERQFRIKFQRGQGYMLNDRKWLHGREGQSSPIRKDRLHRLVFGL